VVVGAAGGQPEQAGEQGGGGAVVAKIDVEPGQRFTVWVGGAGGSEGADSSPPPGGWGFGCGGAGGLVDLDSNPFASPGGGGGGASAVTAGEFTGGANECSDRPDTDTIVALGGGG